MIPILVDGPAVEPVSLEEARAYLRIDDPAEPSAEDGLIANLIVAARLAVEAAARLKLVHQTWRLSVARAPASRALRAPLAPVARVDAVVGFDAAGVAETLDPSLHRLEKGADPAAIVFAPDFAWPAGGVEVTLVAGFGPAAEDVPAPLRQAIRALVARWHENRGDAPVAGARLADDLIPADVALLLASHRGLRLR